MLQSTQQLRTHWSGVIVNLINYVILLNIGIWSYFGKAYIDSLDVSCNAQPLYIVIASFLSSISLLLWRLYTHYLDHQIARLYPDFLFYEEELSVPYDYGIRKYLIKNVPNLKCVFLDNHLKFQEKLEAISILVEKKRIGNRGHKKFNVGVLVLMFAMLVLSVLFAIFGSSNEWICLPQLLTYAFFWLMILSIILCFIFCWWKYFHRNPPELI